MKKRYFTPAFTTYSVMASDFAVQSIPIDDTDIPVTPGGGDEGGFDSKGGISWDDGEDSDDGLPSVHFGRH